MEENLKRKFVSFKFRGRKDIISGFIIDYNSNWTLIKYNPVDYVIDGYLILNNNKIISYKRDEFEEFRERVLLAKNLKPTSKDIFPISDISETLQLITERFEAFQIEKSDEHICYVGRLIKMTKLNIMIEEIDTKATWVGIEKHKIESIRTIGFDSDYVNSLILYNKKIDKDNSGV